MAEKKSEPKMILEREYNVPLRRGFIKVQRFRKANKAVKTLREFMIQHMKSDNIIISEFLNNTIWDKGAGNPPHHVNVIAKKYDDDKVTVELKGEPKKKIEKKSKKIPAKKEDIKEDKKAVSETTEIKEAEVVNETKVESKPAPKVKPKPVKEEIKKTISE